MYSTEILTGNPTHARTDRRGNSESGAIPSTEQQQLDAIVLATSSADLGPKASLFQMQGVH